MVRDYLIRVKKKEKIQLQMMMKDKLHYNRNNCRLLKINL